MCGKPKFLAAVLVFLASYSAYGAIDPQSPGSVQNQPAAEELVRFDQFMGLVKELRSNIDRAQFDLDALLNSLEYDDRAIVEFVKTKIRFEPYSGSLRGALGTLRSRSGNSLDQSILLATLLNNAGFEARIVRGDLSADSVRFLISETLAWSVDRPPIGDVQAIEMALKKIEELYEGADLGVFAMLDQRANSDSSLLNPITRVRHHLDVVLETLESHGMSFDNERSLEPLIEQLTDYFWVEYRIKRADSWISVHPSYRRPSPWGEPHIAKSTFSEAVPHDLVHRVKIEAFVKRKNGLEEETISVAGPWERPAANVASIPISYTNFPLALASMPDWTDPVYQDKHENPFEAAYNEAMGEPTFFAPILNGQIAPAAQFFDLSGNVAPPEVAASNMAEMFQTLGGKTDKAAGALANLNLDSDGAAKDTKMRALLEQWLEITLIRPGEQDKKIKRQLIAMPFEGNEEYVGLGQEVTFTVETGAMPEGYFIDSLLGELERLEDGFRGWYQNDDETNETPSSLGETQSPKGEPKPVWDFHFYLMADQAKEFVGETYVFRPEPSVVARYSNVWLQNSEYQGFDIVNNTRRALKIGDEGIQYAPRDAALFGIWETFVERLTNPNGRAMGFNTIEAFETWQKVSGNDLPEILRPDEPRLDDLTFYANTFIRSDLANGFTLIFPAGDLGTEAPGAWWRVNLVTGETLGMLSIGWGGNFSEYVVRLASLVAKAGGVKVFQATVTCGFIWGVASVVAAVGTGNIDHWVPQLSHELVPVIGYAVAMVLQTPGANKRFFSKCVPAVARVF
jgi:hypothetical protein